MTPATGDAIRPAHAVTPVPENHLRAVLQAHNITERVAVVGIRGYVQQFAESGAGKNLTGVYDDVICVVSDRECRTFLGNTDPSRLIVDPTTRLGRAILVTDQKIRYVRGIHGLHSLPPDRQRQAWLQSSGATIRRWQADGSWGPEIKDQYIGANIHDGSISTTGSAGCQTLPPELWKEFDALLDAELRAAAQTQFYYCLTGADET